MKTKVTECPNCGSRDIGKGKQSGYAVMSPDHGFGIGSTIDSIICTKCGLIIESYVRKPEKFKASSS